MIAYEDSCVEQSMIWKGTTSSLTTSSPNLWNTKAGFIIHCYQCVFHLKSVWTIQHICIGLWEVPLRGSLGWIVKSWIKSKMEENTGKRPSRSTTSHPKHGMEHRKGSDKPWKGNKMLENPPNPWAYCVKLPLLNETDKCDLTDLTVLNCRSNYCIRTVSQGYTEKSRDDELFRIYGSLVNQCANFMRQ